MQLRQAEQERDLARDPAPPGDERGLSPEELQQLEGEVAAARGACAAALQGNQRDPAALRNLVALEDSLGAANREEAAHGLRRALRAWQPWLCERAQRRAAGEGPARGVRGLLRARFGSRVWRGAAGEGLAQGVKQLRRGPAGPAGRAGAQLRATTWRDARYRSRLNRAAADRAELRPRTPWSLGWKATRPRLTAPSFAAFAQGRRASAAASPKESRTHIPVCDRQTESNRRPTDGQRLCR